MNRLTQMVNDSFTPKMAIIVYESEERKNGLYLERRDIENGKMGSGVPLTQKCISDIIQTVAIDSNDESYRLHGTIPPNLIYVDYAPGRMKMIWYNPPEKRHLYFSHSTGIADGDMWVPGLVYMVEGLKLKVFAFKGNKPKDRLYQAPFMNVGEGGVCLGTSKVRKPKETTFTEVIEYWEKMFWKSEFSHILGSNPIEGNLSTLTKELIKSGEKFPTKVLIPSQKNLKAFLR